MTNVDPRVSATRIDLKHYGDFARLEVAPYAAEIDASGWIPQSLVRGLAAAEAFGLAIPEKYGGTDADPIDHGLLHEALGAASASVQGLVNVHNMATHAILRWGSREQKDRWLPALASGERIAGFAMTEEAAGSDLAAVGTRAERDGGDFILRGSKRWITLGASADLFVLLARAEGGPTAFVVEGEAPGLTRGPMMNMTGCRGYMLADLELDDVRVPERNLIGCPGVGLSHVAAVGLDAGRYYLAWGCVGLAAACLEASLEHATHRAQFGSPLRDFQLVQKMLTEMRVAVDASRSLCERAGIARRERSEDAVLQTAIAKYFASTQLATVAHHTVQIHGARGLCGSNAVERYFRDSRVMEIIEGSTQMLESMIARSIGLAHPNSARKAA